MKVRQGGKNVKSSVKGLKNKMLRSGSQPPSINTTDDSRLSWRTETPVWSDSTDFSPTNKAMTTKPAPPREAPPALPLDLLTKMKYLFHCKKSQRRDSFPNNSHNSAISLQKGIKAFVYLVFYRVAMILISLNDDSPTNVQDIDLLKCRDKNLIVE